MLFSQRSKPPSQWQLSHRGGFTPQAGYSGRGGGTVGTGTGLTQTRRDTSAGGQVHAAAAAAAAAVAVARQGPIRLPSDMPYLVLARRGLWGGIIVY